MANNHKTEFLCPYCHKTFDNPWKVNAHLKQEHAEQYESNSNFLYSLNSYFTNFATNLKTNTEIRELIRKYGNGKDGKKKLEKILKD